MASTQTFQFETETCGRCGGSGRYSYNQIDGDRCYGCNGRGRVLTAKAQAAHDIYSASLKVRADSLRVGDLIYIDPFNQKGFFAPIVEIGPMREAGSSLQADGTWKKYMGFDIITQRSKVPGWQGRYILGGLQPDSLIRKAATAAEKAAKFEAAIRKVYGTFPAPAPAAQQ